MSFYISSFDDDYYYYYPDYTTTFFLPLKFGVVLPDYPLRRNEKKRVITA